MFKVPAWEDDVPKTNSTFIQKVTKKKEKNATKNQDKTEVAPSVEKNNNIIINGHNTSQKRKIENKTNNKKDKPNNKKKKTIDSETILETQNFDEILLNNKKKKFNEVIENDDQEVLLFTENKEKKKKKIKKNILNSRNVNNSTPKVIKESITENKNKKRQKITNKNIVNCTKVINEEIQSDNEVNQNIEYIDRKKERFKSLLNVQSHRSHINVSKTGNKLRDRMLERLKAAQFRYLNEKLYTSSGSEAQQLFQSDPAAFETYHQGYQLQVKKWPVNPLDVIVKKIMKMPKSHLIADMGCGEAALSRRLPHTVRSFDLVASAPGVEACDMAHTPLLSASVDVAVYCLALMGTDLTRYLLEASRVLKTGGHLLIAEVESRFDKVEDFTKEVERLGFKLKQLDKSNKVFFFMEFTKVREPPVKKAKLPALTLKPCLYKRR